MKMCINISIVSYFLRNIFFLFYFFTHIAANTNIIFENEVLLGIILESVVYKWILLRMII